MRKLLFLSATIMMCSCGAWAQDDMYFTPSKKAKEVAKANYEKARETYYCGSDRDIDEYNRRIRHNVPNGYITQINDTTDTTQVITSDSIGNDVIDFSSGTGIYPNDEDYTYSKRIERFDGGEPVIIKVYVNDPWYLDPWYDPWFHDSWYYTNWYRWGWHGYGWYGAGWRGYYPWYDPWYDPWFYGPRYHHSVYVPARHHGGIDRGRPSVRTHRGGDFGRNANSGYSHSGSRGEYNSTSRSGSFGRSSSNYGGHSSGGSFGGSSRGGGSFGGHSSGGSFGGHSGGGGARGGRR